MPADASIYGFIKPPLQFKDPAEQFGSMLQLRAMGDQSELSALQRQKLSGDLAEEEAFKSRIADWAGKGGQGQLPVEAYAASPARAASFDKTRLEGEKSRAELGKVNLEVQAAQAKDARDILAGVTDQSTYEQWQKYGAEKGYRVALQSPPRFDPAWQKNHLMTADQFITNAQQEMTRALTEKGQAETARHNKVTELHASLTQKETARHHAAIEGDPQTVEDTAQAIAKGQLAPLSGFALARPMAQNIMARVVQINPEFDPTQFQTRQKAEKDFATGKQGNSVRSFNVALSHLDTLDQLSDALNNRDTLLINRIGNAIATQTGAAAPTNFEAAKKIVADEIVKAIVGSGGGVSDREQAAKTIAAANSPAQLKGVINTYKELMRGQINGLRDQYKATTGKEDFDAKYLSESGRQAAHGAPTAAPKPAAKAGGIKFLGWETP